METTKKATTTKKKVSTAPKAAGKKAKKVEIYIQSPMGGEITPEEIIKKAGQVDNIYVRVDENKAYWVKGDDTGSVELW